MPAPIPQPGGPGKNFWPRLFLTLIVPVFVWSAIRPFDYLIWAVDLLSPAALAAVLILTYKKFRFSLATYFMVFVQVIVFLVGAHFRFDQVPFFSISLEAGGQKNLFDWVSHFISGVALALLAREIFSRKIRFPSRFFLNITVVSVTVCLGVIWEFSEWAAAVASGDSFNLLGNHPWDTHWDLLVMFAGALVSLPLRLGRPGDNRSRSSRSD